VNHGGNHNFLFLYPIDDAVTVNQQFADVFSIELRNLRPERGNRESALF
jgi:hypothetical protein